ncbi:Cholecystokinin receptor type A [Habropoda laboriosa]|uniref:Gastrin/cholecystokinin type B receptor n=1 Tax=Habropoda laboriosa TaxID=597456 RepID=A0A0L7QZH6_9HYME|nr:Cholecystokinin receptor type A [Habropoda laboriosa]
MSDSAVPNNYFVNSDIDQQFVSNVPQLSTMTSIVVNVTLSTVTQSARANIFESLIIPLYGTIFLLSVVGNSLVLITLARNKRMRTVTNVYLLNLAVSDLLLGVFCMPFTLLGQMLKNFVFGLTMCKLIPYFQAVSVSVGVWTLVAISLERYFAICRPLKSRRWQTQFHAYKMIAVIWIASLTWNAPILVVSRLQNIRGGRRKCREEWPSVGTERGYNLFLDGTLLLIPLIVMSLAYYLIAAKLWRGLRQEIRQTSTCQQRLERTESSGTVRSSTYDNGDRGAGTTVVLNACGASSRLRRGFSSSSHGYFQANEIIDFFFPQKVRVPRTRTSKALAGKCQAPDFSHESRLQVRSNGSSCLSKHTKVSINVDQQDSGCPFNRQHVIRSNYMGKSIEAKKKVIRMLFVIVLEFFVCWAPLHVINTWYLFAPELVYSMIGSTGISLIQLLAYISSCCNPITYCFMNRKFRQAFLSLFNCHRCWRIGCRNSDIAMTSTRNTAQVGNNSELSGNESTIYLGKASLVARSGIVIQFSRTNRKIHGCLYLFSWIAFTSPHFYRESSHKEIKQSKTYKQITNTETNVCVLKVQ